MTGKQRKVLVSYAHAAGFGRIFFTFSGPLTERTIEEFTQKIQDRNDFPQPPAIIAITELEG